jgi:hypothetical protein
MIPDVLDKVRLHEKAAKGISMLVLEFVFVAF